MSHTLDWLKIVPKKLEFLVAVQGIKLVYVQLNNTAK